MTKKNILTIILDSVFVIAFNLLFFINGEIVHSASVWTIYGFLHFAYLMVLVTPLISARGMTSVQSKTVIYVISFLYFFVELVFASIFVFFLILGFRLTLSIEIIVTAIYLVVLIVNLLADASIESNQQRHKTENAFIKNISNKIKYISSTISDEKARAKLESLYYLAHSSPSKSGENMKTYELAIMENLDKMEDAASQKKMDEVLSLVADVERILNKRNFQLNFQLY